VSKSPSCGAGIFIQVVATGTAVSYVAAK
jgi:hypothetical protein